MKANSVLKLKEMVWASAGVLAIVVLFFATRSGAKPTAQAPLPPVVEVVPVEQKDVPIYGEWIGTLTGHVNADIKAQVTGNLLTRAALAHQMIETGHVRGKLVLQVADLRA